MKERYFEFLTAAGIPHYVNNWGSDVVEDYHVSAVIICGETQRENGIHGISFWIHLNAGHFLIGLFSGLIYRAESEQHLFSAAKALIVDHALPSGKTPCVIPQDVVARLALTRVR